MKTLPSGTHVTHQLVPCTQAHIDELKLTLRKSDREEIQLSAGKPHEEVLEKAMAISEEAYAVTDGVKVACVFGLATQPQLPGWGIPWMLCSDAFEEVSRPFALQCRDGIEEKFLSKYPRLINMVWSGNLKAIRWLQWCGFTLGKGIPVGPTGAVFIPFMKEKKDV